jgi:hypothetical protein
MNYEGKFFNVVEMVMKFQMIGKQDLFQQFIKKERRMNMKTTVLNIFSRLYGKITKHFLEQEFSQIET